MSIRYGLLGLLSRSPTHGYQLRGDLEAATGDTWRLNIGQVYTTLQRLERDGLVTSDGVDHGPSNEDQADEGDERHRYTLTSQGRQQLHQWFAEPVPRDGPARNELTLKIALALRLPGVDVGAVVDTQRAASMRGLQQLIRDKTAAGDDLARTLVADAAIFNAEAEIRWLDHCEASLRRSKKGVAP